MATQLLSEVKINIRDSSRLEYYLRSCGFNYTIRYNSGTKATVVFENRVYVVDEVRDPARALEADAGRTRRAVVDGAR